MAAIHQFVPMLEPSAVGNHVLAARAVLRDAGYESEIFVGELHPACEGDGTKDVRDYGRAVRSHASDLLVYHLAIGSHMAEAIASRPERLVVDYHNLTPMRYLVGWDPFAASAVAWGRRQLSSLAPHVALGLADSRFNASEMDAAGYPATNVVPILLPPSTFDVEADPEVYSDLMARKIAGGADWLFVGRLAPNKAQHDVVKAFAAYRRFHDANARCHLVGGASTDAYPAAVRRFADRLGLGDAVTMPGSVSEAVKHAYYEAADVFVVCSEHEGFCVPLLEAMHHDVPIVAFASTAVPETLGSGGILVDRKDPFTIASAVDRVVSDPSVRDALVLAGRERLAHFSLERSSAALLAAFEPLASG